MRGMAHMYGKPAPVPANNEHLANTHAQETPIGLALDKGKGINRLEPRLLSEILNR